MCIKTNAYELRTHYNTFRFVLAIGVNLTVNTAKKIRVAAFWLSGVEVNNLIYSSKKVNKSMYGANSKNLQVLGQLNHRCGMTSQTRSFRIGQEFVLLQSEN